MEGTVPLPEAQLDRFLAKIVVRPPDEAALVTVLSLAASAERSLPGAILAANEWPLLVETVRLVTMAEPLLRLVARWIRATDPHGPAATASGRRNLRLGASPRAGEAVCRLARVQALRAGRGYVDAADVAAVTLPAFRHRLLPAFEAEARGLIGDALVADVLHDVPGLPPEVEAVLSAVDRA